MTIAYAMMLAYNARAGWTPASRKGRWRLSNLPAGPRRGMPRTRKAGAS